MAIKEFQIGPLDYFESGYLDGDYTQPNVSKFFLECDIDGFKGGRVITGVYYLGEYIDGTYFHDNSIKATMVADVERICGASVELGDYFEEGYFVDEYAIQRGSRFSVAADVMLLQEAVISLSAQANTSAIVGTIKTGEAAFENTFTQQAIGFRNLETDLYAFGNASLTAEAKLIKDYEAALPDIFDIATDFIRYRNVASDADAVFASSIDTTYSRNRDTTLETQVAFSFVSTPGFIKEAHSGLGVGLSVITANAVKITDVNSDNNISSNVYANGNNQAGAEIQAFSNGALVADVVITTDITLELVNQTQISNSAVKTTDITSSFDIVSSQPNALAGKLFDESLALTNAFDYVARPISFISERLYGRPYDWYRVDGQPLGYGAIADADGYAGHFDAAATAIYRNDVDLFQTYDRNVLYGHLTYSWVRTYNNHPMFKYTDGTNVQFEISEKSTADIYIPEYWLTPNIKLYWSDGTTYDLNVGLSYGTSNRPIKFGNSISTNEQNSQKVEVWYRFVESITGDSTYLYIKVVTWVGNTRYVYSGSGFFNKTLKRINNGHWENTNYRDTYNSILVVDDFSWAIAPDQNVYDQFRNEGWGESTIYDPWQNVQDYTLVLSQFEDSTNRGADSVGVLKSFDSAQTSLVSTSISASKQVDAVSNLSFTATIDRAFIGTVNDTLLFAFTNGELNADVQRLRGINATLSAPPSISIDESRVRTYQSDLSATSSVSCDISVVRDAVSNFESIASQLTATVRLPGIVLDIDAVFSTEQYYFEEGYFVDDYASQKIIVNAVRGAESDITSSASLSASVIVQTAVILNLNVVSSVSCDIGKTTPGISLQLFEASVDVVADRFANFDINVDSQFSIDAVISKSSEITLTAFNVASLTADVDRTRHGISEFVSSFTQYADTLDSLNKSLESDVLSASSVSIEYNRFRDVEATISDAISFETTIVATRVGAVEAVVTSSLTADIDVFRGFAADAEIQAQVSAVVGIVKEATATITDAMSFAASVRELQLTNIYYKIPAEGWTYKISGETNYYEINGETRLRSITGETRIKLVRGESRIHIID